MCLEGKCLLSRNRVGTRRVTSDWRISACEDVDGYRALYRAIGEEGAKVNSIDFVQ